MNKKEFTLIFFISILLLNCSQRTNILDTDLSNLPKSKKVVTTKKESKKHNESLYIKDLVPLKSSEQILSKFKFGKKDPFSKGDTQLNQLTSNFKLTGFLNTENENYVFVNYQGNEGTITKNSIGGLNTNLLPNEAKVINIDIKKRQLQISLDNVNYIFEF